jgi:septum formation protein
LREAGYAFTVRAAEIDETFREHESALAATGRLAWEKALTVAASAAAGTVVLAADTTVVCDGKPFGKPASRQEAIAMLTALAGRNHTVLTCWAAICCGESDSSAVGGVSASTVRMRDLRIAEIRAYADSSEPYDKAGAYAVQGNGGHLIAAIVGSRDNVIGLPVAQVSRALARFGVRPARA